MDKPYPGGIGITQVAVQDYTVYYVLSNGEVITHDKKTGKVDRVFAKDLIVKANSQKK